MQDTTAAGEGCFGPGCGFARDAMGGDMAADDVPVAPEVPGFSQHEPGESPTLRQIFTREGAYLKRIPQAARDSFAGLVAKLIPGLVQCPGWVTLRSFPPGIRYVLAARPRGAGTPQGLARVGELPLRHGPDSYPGIFVG